MHSFLAFILLGLLPLITNAQKFTFTPALLTATLYSCGPLQTEINPIPTINMPNITDIAVPTPAPTQTVYQTNINIFVTIYCVTYTAICPTGLTQSTYTITESCKGDKSNYVTPTGAPPGFTVTTKLCTPCLNKAGQKGVTVTVTEPLMPMVTGIKGQVPGSDDEAGSGGQAPGSNGQAMTDPSNQADANGQPPGPGGQVSGSNDQLPGINNPVQDADGQSEGINSQAAASNNPTKVADNEPSIVTNSSSSPGTTSTDGKYTPLTGGARRAGDMVLWSGMGSAVMVIMGLLAVL